ncbi:MAG: type and secretion system protein, partial [Massilia sp.]|nr:type and secretion system protein [Massilia sp.]
MNTHFRMAAWTVATATIVASPAYGEVEQGTRNCKTVVISPTSELMLGKSSVVPLEAPVVRIIASGPPADAPVNPTAGQPSAGAGSAQPRPSAAPAALGDSADLVGIADIEVQLLSPTDLFLRGKKAGTTNVILQDANGVCYLRDIVVSIDPTALQAKLGELMPEESGIRVKSAQNAIVLTGKVSDVTKLDEAIRVAAAYSGGDKRVVNLVRVTSPQQVMLEVKIAEVSKTLLDRFGIDFARMFTSADGLTSKVMSGIFGGAPALFGQFSQNLFNVPVATGVSPFIDGVVGANAGGGNASATAILNTRGRGSTLFGIDAQKKDGLVRVLAEPNIMAISGQSASFLSGGRIFIPVAQSRDNGGSTITLE